MYGKRIGQILREMPQMVDDVRKDFYDNDTFDPVTHKSGSRRDGYGDIYEHMSSGENGKFHVYKHSYDDDHNEKTGGYDGFVVTNSKGHVHYRINGEGLPPRGASGKRKFIVRNTGSHQDRKQVGKYSNIISHIVTQGHVDEWHSDTAHSRGSVNAYRDLVENHPHLNVEHSANGRKTKVTKENFGEMYKKRGRFVVSRKQDTADSTK